MSRTFWVMVDDHNKKAYVIRTFNWLKSFGPDLTKHKVSPNYNLFTCPAKHDYKLYLYNFLSKEELVAFAGHLSMLFPSVKSGFFSGFNNIDDIKKALDSGEISLPKVSLGDFVNMVFKLKFLKVQISWKEMEKNFLENSLVIHSGNIAQTAKSLGLHRQSLQRKLKKLNIR